MVEWERSWASWEKEIIIETLELKNIDSFCSVSFSLIGSWSYLVLCCTVMSYLVHSVLFAFISSFSVLSGPFQSCLVHSVIFGLIWSCSVLFGPFCLFNSPILILLSKTVGEDVRWDFSTHFKGVSGTEFQLSYLTIELLFRLIETTI